MIVLIDNYDSFTWNLVHLFGEIGQRVRVHRNDKVTVEEIAAEEPSALVLSPGPCTPNEAGICLDVIRTLGATTPILGVCLGHQSIGQAYGGRVVRAGTLMHGKLSAIRHRGETIFRDIESPFQATRYHSLIVERETLPDELQVTAETDDGTIMGLSHRTHPVHGVQFHPESIASQNGAKMLSNFLDLAGRWHRRATDAAA